MTITKIPSAGLEDVVTAGSSGSASQIPVITINSKGQVTGLGSAALDLSTKADTSGSNASGTWPISISGRAAVSSSSDSVAWSGVSGRPTALSEFTNNLGNYLNALTAIAGDVGYNTNCSGNANCGYGIARSGATIRFVVTACDCNCNCNC